MLTVAYIYGLTLHGTREKVEDYLFSLSPMPTTWRETWEFNPKNESHMRYGVSVAIPKR